MAKPTKLWAGLGIVAAAVVAHWAGYQPRLDSRIDAMREIFGGAALRDVTLRAPLYDNAMKILAHLDTMPGGVVVLAHKLGSKSQTLYYLEGLCHTIKQLNAVSYLVFRISLSDKYTPPNWKDLLSQLEKHILSDLLPLCQAFLKAELEKILGTPAPDFPDPSYKAFDAKIKETVAHRVFDLLDTYEQFYKERTEVNFWSLYEALMIFLQHRANALLLFISHRRSWGGTQSGIKQAKPHGNVPTIFGTPHTTGCRGSGFFLPKIFGCILWINLMSKLKYVTKRYCRLNYFDAAQCSELWELWKAHATKTDKEKAEVEKWMEALLFLTVFLDALWNYFVTRSVSNRQHLSLDGGEAL